MRVCTAGADEDGVDGRVGGEIEGEGVAEGNDWWILVCINWCCCRGCGIYVAVLFLPWAGVRVYVY